MKKIYLLYLVVAVVLGCSEGKKSNNVTFKIEGIEEGSYVIMKNETDTIFLSDVSDKFETIELVGEKNEYPTVGFLYLKDVVEMFPVILNAGDTVLVSLNQGKIEVTSKIEREKKEVINSNPGISSRIDSLNLISEEYNILLEKYNVAKKDNDKPEIQRISDEANKLSGDYQRIASSLGEEIVSVLSKNEKNLASLFLLVDISRFSLDDLSIANKTLALLKEYQSVFKIKYLENEINHFQESLSKLEIKQKITVGSDYVDIEANDPEGNSKKLSEVVSNNKVTLLKFWASWCGPCMRSMPTTLAIYDKYKNRGFQVYAFSLDKEKDAWEKGIEKAKINEWIHSSELKFWKSESSAKYGIDAIPAEILISSEGKILGKNLTEEEMKKIIEEII